jgi:hypothetical protein
MRTAKPGVRVERISCKADADPDCRWEMRFSNDEDVSDLVVYE